MSACLEQMFIRASRASEEVMVEREEAKAGAVRAIRDIERRLRECLAGDTLRGLANLHRLRSGVAVRGTSVQYGARVVVQLGDGDRKIDAPIDFDSDALVVTKDGEFAVYTVDAMGAFESWPARDDDFTAQDLDAAIATVHRVLERHVERAERTAANYERLRELAGAIRGALG